MITDKLGFTIDPPGTKVRMIRYSEDTVYLASQAELVMWDLIVATQAEIQGAIANELTANERVVKCHPLAYSVKWGMWRILSGGPTSRVLGSGISLYAAWVDAAKNL